MNQPTSQAAHLAAASRLHHERPSPTLPFSIEHILSSPVKPAEPASRQQQQVAANLMLTNRSPAALLGEQLALMSRHNSAPLIDPNAALAALQQQQHLQRTQIQQQQQHHHHQQQQQSHWRQAANLGALAALGLAPALLVPPSQQQVGPAPRGGQSPVAQAGGPLNMSCGQAAGAQSQLAAGLGQQQPPVAGNQPNFLSYFMANMLIQQQQQQMQQQQQQQQAALSSFIERRMQRRRASSRPKKGELGSRVPLRLQL